MTTAKPIGAVWWRISTKAQADMSPETQILEAREMLEAEGYSVPQDRVIGADWHSLAVLDCPEMETLLSWVRHGEIQAIGMYHGDRLAGNPGQKMFIVDLCDRLGVKLLARYSPIMDGKEGELLEYVRTWGKEQQVIRTQQAAKDGLRDRAKVGGLPPTGRSPYGYSFPKGEHGQDYTRLVANRDWPIAQMIWRKAVDGVTLRRTTKDLYEQGIRTTTGKDVWDPSTISQMLHNPAYAGRVYALKHRSVTPQSRRSRTYGKSMSVMKPVDEWVHLPNVVVEQPVVTWDEYLLVQARLKANKLNSRRNTKREYLLRRMIHCETHGTVYKARHQKRKSNYNVYLCSGHYSKAVQLGDCGRKSISGGGLERIVWKKAVELLTDPTAILGELARRQSSQRETRDSVSDGLGHIDRRLRSVEDAEMKLVSMRLAEDVSESVFERQKALIAAERAWCVEERGRLHRQLERVKERFVTIEQVKALEERIGDKLARATFDDKRFVLEALETRITVAEDGTTRLWFSIPAPGKADDDGAFLLDSPKTSLRPWTTSGPRTLSSRNSRTAWTSARPSAA